MPQNLYEHLERGGGGKRGEREGGSVGGEDS